MTLEQELSGINIEIQQCMMMFNSIMKDLAEILIKQFPDEVILKTYYGVIKETLTMKPQDPINKFVFNIYKNKEYRENIKTGNDEFFKNSKNIKDLNHGLFFQFTLYWDRLNKEKQNYIKSALKTMIDIVEIYIVKRDDGNIIKEKMVATLKKN